MVDPRTLRRWLYRIVFVAIAFVAVFIYVLPLRVGSAHWPGPDLLLALAFAWVMRRPDYVPVLLVAVVMLTADFVFMRPPGLWAALSIIGLEFLRRREPTSRDLSFLLEWAMVAGVMLAMAVAYRLVLAIFMVEQATLGLVILGQVSTLLVYPLVVVASTWALGITKITPSEADEMRSQS
ncbi:rod shape-determining protein MreD [Celeribacter arenosi]|uniref:Rod shape-determining protein MreD n=1 Tax=Celeribacter arenosi TaxID=792649 RepID=A0ABP7K7X7_9RHOB